LVTFSTSKIFVQHVERKEFCEKKKEKGLDLPDFEKSIQISKPRFFQQVGYIVKINKKGF
jgi:hypothetical protein